MYKDENEKKMERMSILDETIYDLWDKAGFEYEIPDSESIMNSFSKMIKGRVRISYEMKVPLNKVKLERLFKKIFDESIRIGSIMMGIEGFYELTDIKVSVSDSGNIQITDMDDPDFTFLIEPRKGGKYSLADIHVLSELENMREELLELMLPFEYTRSITMALLTKGLMFFMINHNFNKLANFSDYFGDEDYHKFLPSLLLIMRNNLSKKEFMKAYENMEKRMEELNV